MTEPKNPNNDQDERKTLVKCRIKDDKEITREECEYLNQKSKAKEKGRGKKAEEFMAKDVANKLCINCDFYPPFNKV